MSVIKPTTRYIIDFDDDDSFESEFEDFDDPPRAENPFNLPPDENDGGEEFEFGLTLSDEGDLSLEA